MDTEPYNPLDKVNLGASVGKALLERDAIRLDKLKRFPGAGIYALYYTGCHKSYEAMAASNRDGEFAWPLYVGKAVLAGARTGGSTKKPKNAGSKTLAEAPVFKRLGEHKGSITATDGLEIEDFYCRYLIVDAIWIPLGETIMIARFAPIWNTLLDGFGNHNPGKERATTIISKWDAMHPGRKWAAKCQPRTETKSMLENEVRDFLSTRSPPDDLPMMAGVIPGSKLVYTLPPDES